MFTNIFLCHTEYHLLMAINVSSELFGDETYRNVIYVIYNKTRLKEEANYDTSPIGNIEYRCINNEIADNIKFVEKITDECTGTLFLYNIYHPTELYIAFRIWKKRLAKCSFCQEGYATYMSINYNIKDHLATTNKVIKSLRSAGVSDFSYFIHLFLRKPYDICSESLNYHKAINSKTIDAVYVTHPDLINDVNKPIIEIPPLSDLGLLYATRFFNYKRDLCIKSGDILFIDQPVNDSNVITFLNQLHSKIPGGTIYIKMHPLSSKNLIENYFTKLPDAKIISESIPCPVELLILTLEGVRIFSSYSSALLTVNNKCSFFYIYPYLQKKGSLLDLQSFIPAKHVKLVNKMDDIN